MWNAIAPLMDTASAISKPLKAGADDGRKTANGTKKGKTMARLIDAEKIEFMPKKDPLHGYPIMNKILFLGRSNGKTLAMVQEALKQSIENQPTVAAVPVKQYEELLEMYHNQAH